MSKIQSIEAMRGRLAEAVSCNDWNKARRCIDRLKGIVIDSLVQNDPKAIRIAGNAIKQVGERLELLADLPMVFDQTALAWQLRADLSTIALAARVRPLQLDSGVEEDRPSDVATLLLRLLSQSNRPMSNTALADRSGKHPAVISRTLKRLERDGHVRRWRGLNGQQLNTLTVSEPTKTSDQLNRLHLSAQPSFEQEFETIRRDFVQEATFFVREFDLLNQSDRKLGAST